MKVKLPAVNQPLIRVLVLTADGVHHMDVCGERPQEVDVVMPGVDVEKAKVGYVELSASGEEVGEPVLLYEPPAPAPVKPKQPEGPKAQAAPQDRKANGASGPATELPPETVKVEEKVEVKTDRKK